MGYNGRIFQESGDDDSTLDIQDFLGTYDYTLDDKNRLSIPAKYRKVMANLKQKTFIISMMEDSCLTLYPYSIFRERISEPLKSLPQIDDDTNEIRRAVGLNTTDVTLDGQGRIMVPINFCQHAGIEKSVKLIGLSNKIELWNPENHEKVSQTPDKKSIKEELKKYRI